MLLAGRVILGFFGISVPIVQVAPWAVLVGGVATPAPALNALSEELATAGFAHVSVLTGPPPALEQASVQSAA